MVKIVIWCCIILFILIIIFLLISHKDLSSTIYKNSELRFSQLQDKGTLPSRVHNDVKQPVPEERTVKHKSKYLPNEFQAGMNLLVYGHPDPSQTKKIVSDIRDLGINSVAITFPFTQDHWQANEVKTNRAITPTISELEMVIKACQDAGLHVMLRPIMDEESLEASGYWRGEIQPTNPEKWFSSYQKLLITYANLAEEQNIEILNIGTEFNSMEFYEEEWIQLLNEIKEIYNGKITYSFNWNRVEHIPHLSFTNSLDYVGIDAYFPLDVSPNATVKQIEKAWKQWIHDVEKLEKKESILITEIGIIPVTGAYQHPYSWELGGTIDWKIQSNYYKATWNSWQPKVHGLYWWCVTIEETNEINYSPLHTPTEQVIKQQLLTSPKKSINYIEH